MGDYSAIRSLAFCWLISATYKLPRYSTLETSGILRNILHDSDIGATRPLHDGELRKATDSLNASTGEIRKQVDILAAQQEYLDNQRSVKSERESRSARDVERLRSKHDLGRQNTSSAVRELHFHVAVADC